MKVKYCRVIEKYRVVEFVAEHNHNTCTPRKTHLCRSHRNITRAQATEVDMAHYSSIAPKATVEFMAKQMGNTGGVLEYLRKMQLEDPNFYYAIQVDEDDLITNIFWPDVKMMADYAHFGDVVCFDMTYRKNKEG
ncbi:hypothetical protein ACSBR2_008482 [Camellia fascicularis]